ncbi:hypothetical protein O6H91_18G056500 [Diphasiastrum complanatum]|uniref:Uncharacterized protein n=1 Tax=Diphasiastrum complanatum TaxID=34168 RepID=A0ACC2B1N4_DIPCM|nr:hypothetical protein O6H91_18G056500 [Diphasiastrum complanatum]
MAKVNLNVDVNRACESLGRQVNDQTIGRERATQLISEHFRHAFPKYNVMVVHSQHLTSFEDSVHTHIEIKTSFFGTTGFEVYIFKRGFFTLLGDGGFQNWCFSGNFKRDGSKVTFYDL